MSSAWGDSWGSSSGSPPNTPTLTVNTAGTLATVSGSTSGSTNVIAVAAFSYTAGAQTWLTEATRTGDGTAALTLTDGYYWARVTSTTAGGTAVSNLYFFRVGTAATGQVHSPADVVRWLLVSLGQATDPAAGTAWPAYCANEPNAPDNVVTTYDTAGNLFGREHSGGEMQEHYGVQIRLRAATHAAGWAKINAITTALDESTYQETVTIGAAQYCVKSARRSSGVAALGNESAASKRRVFTVNMTVHLTVI